MPSDRSIRLAEQEVKRLNQVFEKRNIKRNEAARKLAQASERLQALNSKKKLAVESS